MYNSSSNNNNNNNNNNKQYKIIGIYNMISIIGLLLLLLLLLSVVVMIQNTFIMVHAQEAGGNQNPSMRKQEITTGQQSSGSSLIVQGCFNDFDTILTVEFSAMEINNARCQSFCKDKRFSLSATSGITCSCGNNYPSIVRKTDISDCDYPCAIDHHKCSSFACCGSKPWVSQENIRYTVSFSGEPIFPLEVLRQATFDYRKQNEKFVKSVENLMSEGGGLVIKNSEGSRSENDIFVTPGGICPNGWDLFNNECYLIEEKVQYNENQNENNKSSTSSYSFYEAKSTCESYGGRIATIESPQENEFISMKLLEKTNKKSDADADTNADAAWIGLEEVDDFSNDFQTTSYNEWDVNEPNNFGQIQKSRIYGVQQQTLSGSDKKAYMKFDDFILGVTKVKTIRLAYNSKHITAMQTIYELWDTRDYVAPLKGSIGKKDELVSFTLNSNEEIMAVQGVGRKNIENLTFKVRNTQTNEMVKYGPFGGMGSKKSMTFLHESGHSIIGFMGAFHRNEMHNLAFTERTSEECTIMNDAQKWEDISCFDIQKDVSFICEKEAQNLKCPENNDWQSYDNNCYQVNHINHTDYSTSWIDAEQTCLQRDSKLVSIESQEENNFIGQLKGPHAQTFIGLREVKNGKNVWNWNTFHKLSFTPNIKKGNVENLGVSSSSSSSSSSRIASRNNVETMAAAVSEEKEEDSVIYDSENNVHGDINKRCTILNGDTGDWEEVECDIQRNDQPLVCEKETQEGRCTCPNGWILFECSCYKDFPSNSAKPMNWFEANEKCQEKGAFLPTLLSNDENEFVKSLVYGKSAFIGFNDVLMAGSYEWGYYTNWAVNEPNPLVREKSCVAMSGTTGEWVTSVCGSEKAAFVCEMSRGDSRPSKSMEFENWEFKILGLENNRQDFGKPLLITLKHSRSGQYLAADGNGIIYNEEDENSPNIIFQLVVDRYQENFGLYSSANGYFLHNDGWFLTSGPKVDVADLGDATRFNTDRLITAINKYTLKMGIQVADDNAPDDMLKECEMYVYDLTPASDSFQCWYVPKPMDEPDNYVTTEVIEFIVRDFSQTVQERVPLEEGRLRCENQDPEESITCSISYGEAIQLNTDLSVTFGRGYAFGFNNFNQDRLFLFSTLIDQSQAARAQADFLTAINYQVFNFMLTTFIYDIQYSVTQSVNYVSTHNYIEQESWQIATTVPPQMTVVGQFWMSVVDINYLWQAQMAARGGFTLSSLGKKIGNKHSLSDITYAEDLLFHMYGSYNYPHSGEVIITVNNEDAAVFPFEAGEYIPFDQETYDNGYI